MCSGYTLNLTHLNASNNFVTVATAVIIAAVVLVLLLLYLLLFPMMIIDAAFIFVFAVLILTKNFHTKRSDLGLGLRTQIANTKSERECQNYLSPYI